MRRMCQTSEPEVVCWEFAYQWMFVVAYAMLAATFVIIHFVQKFDRPSRTPSMMKVVTLLMIGSRTRLSSTTYDGKVVDESDPDPTFHAGKESGDDEVLVESEDSSEVAVDKVDGDDDAKEVAVERLDL